MFNNQKFNLIPANINNKSFLLYSKYNPIRDSEAFAEEAYDENVESYFIYGFGLGYHINALEKLIAANDKKISFRKNSWNLNIY